MVDPKNVRDALIVFAKKRCTITYKQLSQAAKVPYGNFQEQMELARIVTQIGREEFEAGRPLLNILLLSPSTDLPSESFFKMAREVKAMHGADRSSFFQTHLAKVFSFWENKDVS